MKIISFVNGKGVSGKSIVSVVTALRLIERGNNVLLMDCDPQCSLSLLWVYYRNSKHMAIILMGEEIKDKTWLSRILSALSAKETRDEYFSNHYLKSEILIPQQER